MPITPLTMDDLVILNDTKTANSMDTMRSSLRVQTSLSETDLGRLRDEVESDFEKYTSTRKQHQNDGKPRKGLKVLFLSSDTGGGHRASAEALGRQFQLLFPGSTYELLDMVENDGGPPRSSIVTAYKHLSNRPQQWKLVYHVSNMKAFEVLADAHLKLMWERSVRRRIRAINPDVVVSVHPMMTNVPVVSCQKISAETGRHLPMFTVVTDLGSAHCLWFANGIEKMYVGSEAIKELAKARGKVPDDKIILFGLPIRHDFAVQSENLGERYSEEGKQYQLKIRQQLNLPPISMDDCNPLAPDFKPNNSRFDRATILVMGGGEGVGSLENIADALYVELTNQGIDALILVVCGRNQKLRTWIDKRDWNDVYRRWSAVRNRGTVASRVMSLSLAETCGGAIGRASFPNPIDIRRFIDIRSMMSLGTRNVESTISPTPFTVSEAKSQTHQRDNSLLDDESMPTSTEETTEVILESADNLLIEPNNLITPEDEDPSRYQSEIGPKQQCLSLEEGISQHELLLPTSDPHSPSFHLYNNLLDTGTKLGEVTVVGLGFIDNMAEYMVAADVLITKAGPGTISEAAALSLPVLLTSFLPGQEEGNVDYVINAGFGGYCNVCDPFVIAEEICMWFQDEEIMKTMSKNAKAYGKPNAARDIAMSIGESTLRWLEHNEEIERGNMIDDLPEVSSLSINDVIELPQAEVEATN
jgi:UDP-N-acetylglucosamine:LPS N-acetylglucosamine transferase